MSELNIVDFFAGVGIYSACHWAFRTAVEIATYIATWPQRLPAAKPPETGTQTSKESK